jgi:hypothetical protein
MTLGKDREAKFCWMYLLLKYKQPDKHVDVGVRSSKGREFRNSPPPPFFFMEQDSLAQYGDRFMYMCGDTRRFMSAKDYNHIAQIMNKRPSDVDRETWATEHVENILPINEMLRDIRKHNCFCREITVCDYPDKMLFGFSCRCGTKWQMRGSSWRFCCNILPKYKCFFNACDFRHKLAERL